jgi:hypothetical protein
VIQCLATFDAAQHLTQKLPSAAEPSTDKTGTKQGSSTALANSSSSGAGGAGGVLKSNAPAVSSSSSNSCSSSDAASPSGCAIDVLTGFHLADAEKRIFVIEGLAGGLGMQVMEGIAAWALQDQEDEKEEQRAEKAAVEAAAKTRGWGSRTGSRSGAGSVAGSPGQQQQQDGDDEELLQRQVLINPKIR